ncbi:MAG: GDSL-type esterase/lipase family protein, partial [Kiritimatiellae bacterium]|nr:GDSL-type esterase/lipase family protein [Kiritimatiellia bacterium]
MLNIFFTERVLKRMVFVAVVFLAVVSGRMTLAAEIPPDGLVLWLDAADQATIAKSDDNSVSQWADKRVATRGLFQSQPAKQPKYAVTHAASDGLPAVIFDGNDDGLLSYDFIKIQEAFIVARWSGKATEVDKGLLTCVARGGWDTIAFTTGPTPGGLVSGLFDFFIDGQQTATLTPLNNRHIVCGVRRGNTVEWEGLYLGGDRNIAKRFWSGEVYEVMVYARVLTEKERRSVADYLHAKWKVNIGDRLSGAGQSTAAAAVMTKGPYMSSFFRSGESIAFLGDSITQQGAATPAGYVSLVISGLKANGIDAVAIPAGLGGHKSDDMLARLEKDVIGKQPAWMALSCGVNDVAHGAAGIPLDKYRENVTQIVDRTQKAGIKVMIMTAT